MAILIIPIHLPFIVFDNCCDRFASCFIHVTVIGKGSRRDVTILPTLTNDIWVSGMLPPTLSYLEFVLFKTQYLLYSSYLKSSIIDLPKDTMSLYACCDSVFLKLLLGTCLSRYSFGVLSMLYFHKNILNQVATEGGGQSHLIFQMFLSKIGNCYFEE
ncbi:hypothetical protein ACJX0J_035860 [Zea mays]